MGRGAAGTVHVHCVWACEPKGYSMLGVALLAATHSPLAVSADVALQDAEPKVKQHAREVHS